MKAVFTICSVNYLAQAKALGDSLLANNPGYEFFICLVDRLAESGVPQELLPSYNIIEAEKINIKDWSTLTNKYNIVELNTAVKASFFKYLFKTYSPESIIYLDPDILVLSSLQRIENGLNNHSIILTPHSTTPVTYTGGLPERSFLNYGIFNLGFIALKNTTITAKFLDWWEEKLMKECYSDTYNGLYVDQLWINLVPSYFEEVYIDKYPGNNVAYWNLHERKIIYENNTYYANQHNTPLVFFHFSKVNIETGELVGGMATTDMNAGTYDSAGLTTLLKKYSALVLDNHYHELRKYKCFYEDTAGKNRKRFIKDNLPAFIKKPIVSFAKRVLGIKMSEY